jgi:GGDEF domain-containing protein
VKHEHEHERAAPTVEAVPPSDVRAVIPRQAGLDPLTGLVDRRWFAGALADAQNPPTRDTRRLGIIAVHVETVQRGHQRAGPAVNDGLLLMTAEVIHACAARQDLAARLSADDFAVLSRSDAAGIAAAASALRERLRAAGISASVGWAMGGRRGGLPAALSAAERRARGSNRAPPAAEAAAARALAAVRHATAASVLLGQAAGILMQWHHCAPDRARRELAYQAHELGLPLTAMARLLLVVSSGGQLDDEHPARGIELDRTVRLATHVARHGVPSTDEHPTPPGPPARSLTPQPTWTVEPPNAASVRMSLPQPNTPTPDQDLWIAGRYQAAASRAGSGGDWFDAFILPDGTIGLVLGDVAGHDTLAVTLMMQLRTLVRSLAKRSDIAPNEVLRRLDRRFVELGTDRLATIIFGWVHTDVTGGRVLHWCNASHLPPVLVTRGGDAVVLDTVGDVLLGLGGHTHRSDLTATLPPQATLLLYSDGLVETRTADIDDRVARLCSTVRPFASLTVTELRDALMPAMVDPHTPDDVALLAIRTPPCPTG